MSDTTKDIIKIVLPFILGGLGVICTDFYADFRDVELKEEQIDYFKDYKLSMDSVLKANKELSKHNNDLTHKTFSNMKEMLENDEKLTIEAIQIAEDSIVIISPFQTDSIRDILIKE